MTALLIWFVGWCFATGYMLPNTKTLENILCMLLLLILWPLLLGCYMRDERHNGFKISGHFIGEINDNRNNQ